MRKSGSHLPLPLLREEGLDDLPLTEGE